MHHEAIVNGVRLHYVEAGAGPLVLLLHGFPEFWYGWRHQIPALAAAGFRVIAPDMRGYNLSEKPPGITSYRADVLAGDAAGLIKHAGVKRATIVGHDWGGFVAWSTALRFPELVEQLVVLNTPHPAALMRELRKPPQALRFWYQVFFQLPWLPEAAIRAFNYRTLGSLFRRSSVRPGAFTDEDIRRYKAAFAQPGALTAALNYYRAVYHQPLRWLRPADQANLRRIELPTLLIWGVRDVALTLALTYGLETWVPRIRVERIREAGHFVQHDAPERVNELLLTFLDGGP